VQTDVVMFSGGLGSWAAGKRRRETHPDNRMVLLFADTKTEDADLYRFLPEAAANIGAELVVTAEGRDIWQVFRDRRFLGNTRVDPCSEELKRTHLRKYIEREFDPATATIVIGFGPEEGSRIGKAAKYWHPWRVAYPMADTPHLAGYEVLAWAEREGLDPPALYDLGFEHNNCGGGCIKAGVGQFVHLLKVRPDTYAKWEAGEQGIRQYLGKDVAILRDRRGGTTKPMTLTVLRERVAAGEEFPRANRFSCGCFAEPEPEVKGEEA
jgi:hypothetical protein